MTNFLGLGEKPSKYENQLLTSKSCTSNFSLYPQCQTLCFGYENKSVCGHAELLVEWKNISFRASEKLKNMVAYFCHKIAR